jgi:branched-chain amino acid transport system permease protein
VATVEGGEKIINTALDGVTRGSVYGVVALGYTLVYGILQLINFAHGDVFALSGLVASTLLLSVFDISPTSSNLAVAGAIVATLAITVPLFAVINGSIERVAYRPLRNAPRLAPLITAVGMSFIVSNSRSACTASTTRAARTSSRRAMPSRSARSSSRGSS